MALGSNPLREVSRFGTLPSRPMAQACRKHRGAINVCVLDQLDARRHAGQQPDQPCLRLPSSSGR
jgi:hypothetical protein